jgi:hypothetical protein
MDGVVDEVSNIRTYASAEVLQPVVVSFDLENLVQVGITILNVSCFLD